MMENRIMSITVCLAAYRGERYIREQILSALPQLGKSDTLLVSDDEPGGETERIVRGIAAEDSRVRYLYGPGKGVVRNFESLLTQAEGDVLFLCDQDDVWMPNKVEAVMRELDSGADLVLHDAVVADACLRTTSPSFFALHRSRPGFLRNFLRNNYMGCCMAFRRSVAKKALPFPDGIPMHDQWIGLTAEKYGCVRFLPQPLIIYRQHGGNVTGGRTSAAQKIRWRVSLLRAWIKTHG